MHMSFRHLVMREFQNDFIEDPHVPCMAYVCRKDSPYMSLQHQMVFEPGNTSAVPKQIHLIASLSKKSKAVTYYKQVYKTDLVPVGHTYCVAPYVMGYARLGKDTERNINEIVKIISAKGRFDEYLCNWLETDRGYDQMIRDISAEDPDERSAEQVLKDLNTGSPREIEQRLMETKLAYVAEHAGDPKAFGYGAYVQKRMNEFREAMNPLTTAQHAQMLQKYYTMSLVDEEAMCRRNTKAYAKEPMLLRGLVEW